MDRVSEMWYLLAIVVVAVLLAFFKQKRRGTQERSAQEEFNYQTVKELITPAETAFLSTLDEAVQSRARVFCMVRVADILKPSKSLDKSQRQTHLNKTTQKHFDFVLCDLQTLQPLCVIELNDKSHKRKDRRERDAFLAVACKSANLPLYFITASNRYEVAEIASHIDLHLPVQLKQAS